MIRDESGGEGHVFTRGVRVVHMWWLGTLVILVPGTGGEIRGNLIIKGDYSMIRAERGRRVDSRSYSCVCLTWCTCVGI